MLDKYGIPLYTEHIAENLLDQIMSPNTELNIEFNICSLSHSSTFVKVSTYIYTVVSRIHPSTNPSSGRFRKCGIYATDCGKLGSEIGVSFNI